MTSFEELLARDGKLVYKTKGVSMEPMLRQNRDLVVIRVPVSRLRKFDVALYKRGKDYVLHRVIEAKDGYYLIRGDNTYSIEHVPDSAVIGVLSSFQRKGKLYETTNPGYQRYVRVWNAIYPLRLFYVRCRQLLIRIAKKMGLLPAVKKLLRRK